MRPGLGEPLSGGSAMWSRKSTGSRLHATLASSSPARSPVPSRVVLCCSWAELGQVPDSGESLPRKKGGP